jgi:hypothetical protein
MTFLFLLIPLFAWAGDCPEGFALSKKADFYVQLRDDTAKYGYRNCKVEGDPIAGTPLEIVGCYPWRIQPAQLFVKAPEGWNHECFSSPQKVLRVFADQFEIQPKEAPPAVPEEVGDCEYDAAETLDPDIEAGMTSILRVIQSDYAKMNGFKQIGHLEKYHRCLLTGKGKKNQYDNYVTRYREIIEDASEAFKLPMALLTCSCGRESMFDASAESHTNVKGICQNVGASLEDVNRWIQIDGSEIQKRWRKFIQLLGDKIEFKSCLRAELSQRTVEHCPSLGLGAASVYYSYLYKEATEEDSIGRASWDSKSLDTLITLAAANNVGPARVKALHGKKKEKWAKALLAETCKKDGVGKFNEVKSHMLALHSCLLDGSWLDHQGRPLGGECQKLNTPESVAEQQAERAAFASRLPSSCK